MHTTVNISNQDIEDAVERALSEFAEEHNRTPTHLVIGRLAYEEFRDMSMLGKPSDGSKALTQYKGLEIIVLEEPVDLLSIGCKPD